MRVGVPQLLVVLSHELRGATSVLQGYIRLLHRQYGSDGPDAALLDAMHTATNRLTAMGHDASTLAHWLESTVSPASPPPAQAVADLLAAVAALLPDGPPMESRLASADQVAVPTGGRGLLARALAEVIRAVARAHGGHIRLQVHVEDATLAIAVVPTRTGHATAPLAFDGGGTGLGLVLASYVLDAHQARVTTLATGAVDVRLPCAGGAS